MRAQFRSCTWGACALLTIAACGGSGEKAVDSSIASVTKAVGAADQSAGLATQYPPPPDTGGRWTFDEARPGEAPGGFLFARTGDGRPGQWIVRAAPDAPSAPNVLVQTDTDRTSDRYPVAVVRDAALRDLVLSVRCKPLSGRVDQACGLVFRYRDENNYYVTRANALENNVRLYFVRSGKRREIASWSGEVRSGAWHTLGVEARGDQLDVIWNGRRVISKRDDTFKEAGRMGVWLKADSFTEYDDLTVRP